MSSNLPEPTHQPRTQAGDITHPQADYLNVNAWQSNVLLISILIVALCGIAYELIIGTVSSYLLGNSVYQFSLTIGTFMFAMGIGSYLSKLLGKNLLNNFIVIEVVISLIGGACSLLLFIVFPMANAIYTWVMYSLIIIIGALVGMEIPILTTILSYRRSTRESIANVMSLDYLGALIGSVSFPLLLLPHLGLIRSSFAIGLANIFTAIVNIYFFRKTLKNTKLLMSIALSIFIMLVVFMVAGTRLTSFAENHLYFDQVIYQKQTPYQKLTLTRSNSTRDYRLFIDGHLQFSSRDEYRYHEALVHPVMSLEGKIENVLVLGGGDGLAVREVLKYPEVKVIDLVDIDPEITRMGKELPMLAMLNKQSLHHTKVNVFNADAFGFINQPGKAYDRVIIDMPDPHNEAINKLYSKEFYKMISRRMSPNGVLVSQSSSPFFTRRTFWGIEKTLSHVYSNTESYHITVPTFGIWGFHMASNNRDFPSNYNFQVENLWMNTEVMEHARFFSRDIAKIDVPINSIMEPKLYHLYLEDLNH
ncbi:polyamine aminopropyltransferase [Aliikangiella sp. IMCC44359]|uniref:polyamine aminopropyltransferase n=1 Tax=Aliikangiella sp. IMCC44359 TaxID=3459125 RepID=UPI00403B0A48